MGECYWCMQPHCDPWGSCEDIDPSELESMTYIAQPKTNELNGEQSNSCVE